MPARFCIGCGKLFDRDTTHTLRCPACQPAADNARYARRGSTSERGYDSEHQAERARQLEAFEPGQPCARCGEPMRDAADTDLGHTDDRTGYRGLEHRSCNRAAGARNSHRGRPADPAAPAAASTTRDEVDYDNLPFA